MNIWFFVILLVAIALVIGPVSMLRPRPAQRRKEALRLHATKQGVRFGLRKQPKLKTDMEEPEPAPVYYLAPTSQILVKPGWILMRTSYEHDGNFYGAWDWHGEYRPNETIQELLRNHVPELPESVTLISQGEAGTCIFWAEKEDKDVLDRLITLLKMLQAAEE